MAEITAESIQNYIAYLQENERSGATIEKYRHDLYALRAFVGGRGA